MENSPFIARERELAILQNELDSKQSKMLILYGRRRVGKTHLVTLPRRFERRGSVTFHTVSRIMNRQKVCPRDQIKPFDRLYLLALFAESASRY